MEVLEASMRFIAPSGPGWSIALVVYLFWLGWSVKNTNQKVDKLSGRLDKLSDRFDHLYEILIKDKKK